MIYTKESDPPAYDSLVSLSGSRSLPTTTASPPTTLSPNPPSSASSSSSSSWLPWTAAQRMRNEVQASVRDLVRQLVVGLDPSSSTSQGASLAGAASGILHSCADACAKHDVALATILQDKYIEEHSPLYWAIVKQSPTRSDRQPRPPPVRSEKQEEAAADAEAPDVLGVLLSYATPMTPGTITELRLACLSVSDQTAFQRLRLLVPKFSSLSGADRILLGPSISLDDVTVEIWSGSNSDGGFAVNMQFSQFHRRLMVSRQVGIEFMVRNRIWRFSLGFADRSWTHGPRSGDWCARLSLQDSSPPTWFDGRLILAEPQGITGEIAQSADTPRPANIVLMRCNKHYRLEPSHNQSHQIAVSLADNQAFSSLQYSETSHIPMNETLTLRLEAKLIKPSKNGPSWNDNISS